MPVASFQTPGPAGAARVLIFTCEECGGRGHFSEAGADPLKALHAGDVKLAGRWFCGWREGRPMRVAVKQTELQL